MPTTTKKQLTEHELLTYALDFLYNIHKYTQEVNDGDSTYWRFDYPSLMDINFFLMDNFGIDRPMTAKYNPVMDVEINDFVPTKYVQEWDISRSPKEVIVIKDISKLSYELPPESPTYETRLFTALPLRIGSGEKFYRWIRTE